MKRATDNGTKADGEVLYQERLFDPVINIVLGLCTVALLVLLLTLPPFVRGLGLDPFWSFFVATLLVGLTWLNMSSLRLRLYENGVEVRLGVFATFKPWSSITEARLDERSLWFYGGFGIRSRRQEGGLIRAYIFPFAPRITLVLDAADRHRELVFSSRRADELLALLDEHLTN